ncbi:MAG: DUF4349 domain-containing protein [Lachnospiraceae bacterium]|nr:DUF4349 domain-containing protein [Lachnospiraceae bacterium]
MKKRILSIMIAAVTVTGLLAGCGSSSSSTEAKYASDEAVAESAEAYDYADDDVYDYREEAVETDEAVTMGKSTSGQAPSDAEIMSNSTRKLIKTVNITAETREFDKLIANVTERINSLGGYAQSTDISGNSFSSSNERRSAFIVARIPANKLDFFVKGIEDESNITSKNESAEDVTLQYADVEAHKESLKIEQARLNELLEQATSLENIIELENRLTEVRYEIESYESRLRTMNNQVEYSTVNLNVYEVKEYTPEPVEEKSFGQRLAEGFLESCENAWETIQDFIIGFVSFLPMLIVILLILFVIFLIIYGIVRAIMAFVKKTSRNRPPRQKKGKIVATALAEKPELPADKEGTSDDAGAETEKGKDNA